MRSPCGVCPIPGCWPTRREARLANGKIDPIASVRGDRIYLFSGKEDRTVVPAIVAAAADFYRQLGLPDENICASSQTTPPATPSSPSSGASACDVSGKPYVVDCDYDQAGALLSTSTARSTAALEPAGTFTTFDQRPFIQGMDNHGMSDDRRSLHTARLRQREAAAACTSPSMAAPRIAPPSAKPSSSRRDLPAGPIPTAHRAVSPDGREPHEPAGLLGLVGLHLLELLDEDAPQITAVHRMLERLGASRGAS